MEVQEKYTVHEDTGWGNMLEEGARREAALLHHGSLKELQSSRCLAAENSCKDACISNLVKEQRLQRDCS